MTETKRCCEKCASFVYDTNPPMYGGPCREPKCPCHTPVSEPTPPPTEGYGKKAHLKWLSKAKTAKIDGSELTVLPFGYLSQAVDESVAKALAEQKARMVEVVEGIKHKDEFGFKDRPFYGTMAAQNAVLNYNKACDDIIKALSK